MLFVFAVFLLTPPPPTWQFLHSLEPTNMARRLSVSHWGKIEGEEKMAQRYESLSVRHPSKSVRPIAAFTCQGHSADVSGGGGGGGETHKDH